MPAVNPRITVTIKPEVHAILRRLSVLTGNSQSAMIGDLLDSSQPVFERMLSLLEAAERIKAEGMQAPDSIRQSLDDAQAKLEQQLGLALETMDSAGLPILQAAESVSRRSARSPISNRGVTPHGKTLKVKGKEAGQPVVKRSPKKGS